jgi:UDP-N-acetylmuramate dehydrogenase
VKVFKDISLKKYNTFGLEYKADCIVHLENEEEVVSVFTGKSDFIKPFVIIGAGSNILFIDDFKGTILKPSLE